MPAQPGWHRAPHLLVEPRQGVQVPGLPQRLPSDPINRVSNELVFTDEMALADETNCRLYLPLIVSSHSNDLYPGNGSEFSA